MSVKKLQRVTARVPFSHESGIKTILWGTPYVLEVFHTALRLYHLHDPSDVVEVVFQNTGLVSAWTVFFDYDRRKIVVEGSVKSGFFRYIVKETADGITLTFLKNPLPMCGRAPIPARTPIVLKKIDHACPVAPRPFLDLGCNKDPNIDRMRVSPLVEEIVPLVYHQAFPCSEMPRLPVGSLLGEIVQGCSLLEYLKLFWRIGLEGNCVPKRYDTLFYGYEGPLIPQEVQLSDVLPILSAALRALFIQESKQQVSLLPALPKQFIAGRLLGETIRNGHTIGFEWHRNVVRRVLFQANADDEILFHTSLRFCSVRCLTSKAKKQPKDLSEPLVVRKGSRYLLDNFSRH